MTTKLPYPEEFKIEAVKQIKDRGYRVADVSIRMWRMPWVCAQPNEGPTGERRAVACAHGRRLASDDGRLLE